MLLNRRAAGRITAKRRQEAKIVRRVTRPNQRFPQLPRHSANARWHRASRPPLNEGRGLNPGDTSAE